MSLRSEAVRLALRWLIKRQGGRPSIKDVRISMAALAAKVPRPPAGTEVTALKGIPGDHIATRESPPDRHVLYLHGGGYVAGSPALYRQFTHRVATATRAQFDASIIVSHLRTLFPPPSTMQWRLIADF